MSRAGAGDWMVARWVEMQRISRGLVAMVVEGQTRNFRWSATPALLMADLHRAGLKLRKPLMSAITESDVAAGITRKTSFPQQCQKCRNSSMFWAGEICLACEVKRKKAMADKLANRS